MTARRRPLGTGAHVLEFRLQHRGARANAPPALPTGSPAPNEVLFSPFALTAIFAKVGVENSLRSPP